MLAQEGFRVSQDRNARASAAAAEKAVAAAAAAEVRKRDDEVRRLAMIDERRAKPLSLRSIDFLNTTKTGARISGATNSFEVSKVLFVGWEVKFDNRLYRLQPNHYQGETVYIRPHQRNLGDHDQFQPLSAHMTAATFSEPLSNLRCAD